MSLPLLHRRLAVLLSLSSLLAFAGGAGMDPFAATLLGIGLTIAFFWQPSSALSARMERVWLPIALLLVARAVFHFFVIRDDVVVPAVDVLFLLLAAECLRSLKAANDARIYSLSFALLLASTAYRPGLLFLPAFIAYVVLATVLLFVGFLRRSADRHGAPDRPLSRHVLVGIGVLGTLPLLTSAIVFLTFPRVSRGWAGRGDIMAASIAGFADEVALGAHGGRIYGNPRVVLRVEFPQGVPSGVASLYWRGRSYDHFDGVRWSRASRIPPAQTPPAWYEEWGGEIISQRIYGASLDTRVLFALHPLMEVDEESAIQAVSDNTGDHMYWGFDAPRYTAYSLSGRPTPTQLRNAEGSYVPAEPLFTQLPNLSEGVRSLADSLMGDLPTAYDRVVALQRWFHTEFRYSLELPRTAQEATLESFLLNRRTGHCEYFSTAMAMLLRTQGIPTREVNGFLGGEWSEFGKYLAVTQNEAHAWVEVWFPGFGWVPFDPTPPGRGETLAATSWNWPGRFFLDAIQHRWNKWVLDYSFQTQLGLFERGRKVVVGEPNPTNTDTSAGPGPMPRWLLWLSVLALILFPVGFHNLVGQKDLSRETRLYLRLREACRRAGFPAPALHSPGALTHFLRLSGHPATGPAEQLVNAYLRQRFSGVSQDGRELRAMAENLREARFSLRKRARE